MRKRQNMMMDATLTLDVELLHSVEGCDLRAGFPHPDDELKKLLGVDKLPEPDQKWDWGDTIGTRRGDYLSVCCYGSEFHLYKIHGVVTDPPPV